MSSVGVICEKGSGKVTLENLGLKGFSVPPYLGATMLACTVSSRGWRSGAGGVSNISQAYLITGFSWWQGEELGDFWKHFPLPFKQRPSLGWLSWLQCWKLHSGLRVSQKGPKLESVAVTRVQSTAIALKSLRYQVNLFLSNVSL